MRRRNQLSKHVDLHNMHRSIARKQIMLYYSLYTSLIYASVLVDACSTLELHVHHPSNETPHCSNERIVSGPLSSIIFSDLSSGALWCDEHWNCDLLIGLVMYLSPQSF